MVFQEPMTALNPVVTCGEQIGEMLSQHVHMGRAARRQAILDIMRRVHLPDPERIYASYPHQLSGGQRQRIVIAIALILKPALLICDEPTTALDVTTQAEILELIRELQTQNDTAVLFITHDFGVVAEIADQVAVLELGHMIEQGDKHEVLTRPSQPYTRMLLDAVPELSLRKRQPLPEGDPLLFARKVSKAYGTGSWPLSRRHVHALQEASVSVRPRVDGRHCWRIRFGKVDPGSLHRPTHRADFGRHRGERALRRSPARATIVTVSARRAGHFPGSISLA
jgi:peptide/nickel transport system ATP-binding protein